MADQPRISARALIVQDGGLLLVNATPDKGDGLWCVPGGGVDHGEDLKSGLRREIYEETGLNIEPGDLAAVSEFFDRNKGFHQIDLFFYASAQSDLTQGWIDHAGVVEKMGFYSLTDMMNMAVVPSFLKEPFWLNPRHGVPFLYRGWEERV